MNVWTAATLAMLLVGGSTYVVQEGTASRVVSNLLLVETTCKADLRTFRMTEKSARNLSFSMEVTEDITIMKPDLNIKILDNGRITDIAFGNLNAIDIFDETIYVDVLPGITRNTEFKFRNVTERCMLDLRAFSRASQEITRKMR